MAPRAKLKSVTLEEEDDGDDDEGEGGRRDQLIFVL